MGMVYKPAKLARENKKLAAEATAEAAEAREKNRKG